MQLLNIPSSWSWEGGTGSESSLCSGAERRAAWFCHFPKRAGAERRGPPGAGPGVSREGVLAPPRRAAWRRFDACPCQHQPLSLSSSRPAPGPRLEGLEAARAAAGAEPRARLTARPPPGCGGFFPRLRTRASGTERSRVLPALARLRAG